ncbi:Tnfrsf19 [Phodopus roborovskii]|uniref:Tnfrsf19 protein n=1 Tax=Phodopus roborovskii TaxID=109678 RepID=A0AAU9ZPR6_PHORO|nr:Tnfrsf19 [Phodopus roborovskii]
MSAQLKPGFYAALHTLCDFCSLFYSLNLWKLSSECQRACEISHTECGFGYGEDAQCVPCRPHRFKEDWGSQKCKPCVDCALVNRFQRANCSHTSDAVCGDCLPGFYRKTKLVGFQDMECVPCGDPPPPYEPHWLWNLCSAYSYFLYENTLLCILHLK